MRKQKIIFTVVLAVLMLGMVGLYVWRIVHDGKSFTDDLTKFLLVFAALASSMIRIHTNGGGKTPLSFYEKHFEDDLKGAFKGDTFSRKKLITALKLYCEDNHRKALKYLFDLKGKCKTYDDRRAVSFFTALVLSDAGLVTEAINEYNNHLRESPRNSTALSNLGLLFSRVGDNESAAACYQNAIEADKDNAYAYLNMASLLRSEYELDEAEVLAKKALELKPDMYQAATQLACIYAAKGDTEQRKKYYQIAIANGENAGGLKCLLDNILLGEDDPDDE